MIRVVIVGAAGRMGREAILALQSDPKFEVVSAVVRDANAMPEVNGIVAEADLPAALDRERPDAVLDLSRAPAARNTAHAALSRRIPLVSGVTGLSDSVIEEIRGLTTEFDTPALIVPNFAIGAVLMMRFAELAARWIPDVEIIEFHHEKKVDAPSGTAMLTAQRIAAARNSRPLTPPTSVFKAEGARGGSVEGISVHSVRLPGLLAHQEVIFGAPGEILTVRHDTADRSVYMPGVKLCLTRVGELSGLQIGMDTLLFD